jgi:DNA polymerase-3 subunit epsilon
MLGYDFQHHDALEDARAAAMIMLAACKKTSIPVEDWISRVKQPLSPTRSSSGKRQDRVGNPDGVFYGEAIVFTGKLQIPRREAAEIAATAGFRVANSVTTKTSVLVVGDKDLRRHPGDKLSSKQRKAEDFVAKGYPIRILKESDFREMMKLSGQDL